MLFTAISVVSTAIHLIGFSSGVAAQKTEVTCGSNYTWAQNSLGQNPCLVASFLQGVCNGGSFDVQVLPPDTHYAPPSSAPNQCECNTVVYSLISACGDCQGHSFSTWTDWSVNCTGTKYLSSYPEAIPAGTAVPAWAYLDVLGNNDYSPQAARLFNGAESTAQTTSTLSSTTPVFTTPTLTPFSITPFPTPSFPPLPISGSGGSKSNVGAIVGGVVGGVGGIAIVAGLILFFVMRSRRQNAVAPSAAYMDSKMPLATPPLATPPPMGQYPAPAPFAMQPNYTGNSSGVTPSMTSASPPTTQYSVDPFLPPPRPYDPSDPSTFPTGANTTLVYPTQPASQGYPSPTTSPSYGSQTNMSHQYRGTPQV